MRLPFVFFLLLFWATALGQLREADLSTSDGGKKMDFEIALDELEPIDQKRAERKATKRITRVQDRRALRREARRLARMTGDQFNLVLYEQGQPRSLRTRRVARRSIQVKFSEKFEIGDLAKQAGAVAWELAEELPGFALFRYKNAGDSLEALEAVRLIDGILKAEPVLARQFFKRSLPNDTFFDSSKPNYLWHLKNVGTNGGTPGIDLNVETAWERYTGYGVAIGVVDDGLQNDHPDLDANTDTDLDRNWLDGLSIDASPRSDADGHGTSCAGIAAGTANNSFGIAGVAYDSTLVGLRLIGDGNQTSDVDISQAITWALNEIDIKTNSWGPIDAVDELSGPGFQTKEAFERVTKFGRRGLGSILVWSSGNGGEDSDVNYDGFANSIYTIAVGSVDDRAQIPAYSEPGAAKLISAPSDGNGRQSITTTDLTSLASFTSNFGGTSASTPMVAGVCALMLEANPNLNWRDVQEILIASARKVVPSDPEWRTNANGYHFHHEFGAGLVDATAAVNLAETWQSLPEQESAEVLLSELNLQIPDADPQGIELSFPFSSSTILRAEHVTVTLDIQHPKRGDLAVTLVSPSGIQSRLARPRTDNNEDYPDWEFMTVRNWGEESAGTWKLQINDTTSEGVGTLKKAKMKIYGSSAAPPTQPPVFLSADNVEGNLGAAFRFPLAASNQPSGFTTSALPPGLSLDPNNFTIIGTPSAEGSFTVTATATNSNGITEQTITIFIGERLPEPPVFPFLPETQIVVDRPFDLSIAATNFPSSYTASALPAGLAIDQTEGRIFGVPTQVGTFSIDLSATNMDGVANTTLLLIIASPLEEPLSRALDSETLLFGTSGANPWSVQSEIVFAGTEALVSGNIVNGEQSILSTMVEGPGRLAFQWRVSSERSFDYLIASVDRIPQDAISGEDGWRRGEVLIPPGLHEVTWNYLKDETQSDGDDRAWLDNVSFLPGIQEAGLLESLDFYGLNWLPDPGWTGQTQQFFPGNTNQNLDGQDAAITPPLGDFDSATLRATLQGPGLLTFRWRVSSEPRTQGGPGDRGQFFLMDNPPIEISGSFDWSFIGIQIPSGETRVRWVYQKDSTKSLGADRLWLDQINYEPSFTTEFERWQLRHFTSQEIAVPGLTGMQGDFDSDSHDSLTEFAFNLNPRVPDLHWQPFVRDTQHSLLYEADLSKSSIRFQPTSSSDLQQWEPMDELVIQNDDGVEFRRASIPPGAPKQYFRMEIQPR